MTQILFPLAAGIIRNAQSINYIRILPLSRLWVCDLLGIPCLSSYVALKDFLEVPENKDKIAYYPNPYCLTIGNLLKLIKTSPFQGCLVIPSLRDSHR